MCGITGAVNLCSNSIDINTIDIMLGTLKKRGPDECGMIQFPNCILGHTRLSIIDLSTGKQPMADIKKRYTITFNGEIYNYKELKKSLENRGHTFLSNSDTEVIVEAYKEYGTGCLEYLDGMFAFGIWDDKKKELFLARDRFGEKPLFYTFVNNTLYFASEIKAILKTSVSREIDLTSLDNYLSLLYVPPWRTIYKSIKQLKPAHYILYKGEEIEQKRYWKIEKTNKYRNISETEAKKTVLNILSDSVKSRMVSDVEVGTFLSGGIDSSIIASLAQKKSATKIKTFSAGFENFIDELPFAKEVAKIAKTEHYEKQINFDLLNSFKQVSAYFDSPFADSSNIPTHLISKFAREKVKVVLSGDGGDELFWGYGQYTEHQRLPRLKKIIKKIFSNPFSEYLKKIQHFDVGERRLLLKDTSSIESDPTTNIDFSEAKTDLEKINLVDFYMALPGDILTKVDQSSMMNSLEVRAPFLNHKLAEFAYNIPPFLKINNSQGKIVLKETFKNILPKNVLLRKKQGFGSPIKEWLLEDDFKEYVNKSLLSKNTLIEKYLNLSEVRKIVRKFYAGDYSLKYKVWILLSLEEWLKTHTK